MLVGPRGITRVAVRAGPVIAPAVPPARDHARLPELLEMKRQQGLGRPEFDLQFTHAAFTAGKEPDQAKPGLFGYRLESLQEVRTGRSGLGRRRARNRQFLFA